MGTIYIAQPIIGKNMSYKGNLTIRQLSKVELGRIEKKLQKIAEDLNYIDTTIERKDDGSFLLKGIHRTRGDSLELSMDMEGNTEISESRERCDDILGQITKALDEEIPGIVEKKQQIKEKQKERREVPGSSDSLTRSAGG